MDSRIIRRTAVAFGAAVAVSGGAVAYALTPVTVNTVDTVVRSSTSRAISTSGGVFTDVLSVNLPPGNWVLSSSGNLVDWGPSDYYRCRIVVGGTGIAGVTTMVGNGAASGAHGPASFVSPFSLTGAITVGASATATVQCWHDSYVSSAAYVDPGASFYAHRSGSLNVANQ